jgi:hypothetical protein
MLRLFTARNVLASENEHAGVYRQTKIELKLLEAEARRRDITLPPAPISSSVIEPTS